MESLLNHIMEDTREASSSAVNLIRKSRFYLVIKSFETKIIHWYYCFRKKIIMKHCNTSTAEREIFHFITIINLFEREIVFQPFDSISRTQNNRVVRETILKVNVFNLNVLNGLFIFQFKYYPITISNMESVVNGKHFWEEGIRFC